MKFSTLEVNLIIQRVLDNLPDQVESQFDQATFKANLLEMEVGPTPVVTGKEIFRASELEANHFGVDTAQEVICMIDREIIPVVSGSVISPVSSSLKPFSYKNLETVVSQSYSQSSTEEIEESTTNLRYSIREVTQWYALWHLFARVDAISDKDQYSERAKLYKKWGDERLAELVKVLQSMAQATQAYQNQNSQLGLGVIQLQVPLSQVPYGSRRGEFGGGP